MSYIKDVRIIVNSKWE